MSEDIIKSSIPISFPETPYSSTPGSSDLTRPQHTASSELRPLAQSPVGALLVKAYSKTSKSLVHPETLQRECCQFLVRLDP